jgi:hypothetical protein
MYCVLCFIDYVVNSLVKDINAFQSNALRTLLYSFYIYIYIYILNSLVKDFNYVVTAPYEFCCIHYILNSYVKDFNAFQNKTLRTPCLRPRGYCDGQKIVHYALISGNNLSIETPLSITESVQSS